MFIILVSLTVTLFSEKLLIFTWRIRGFMSNLSKKSWKVPKIHLSEYCARIDTLKLTNHKERARPNILNYSRYTAESQELRSNKMIEILWKLKMAQREVWRHFCFNLLLICTRGWAGMSKVWEKYEEFKNGHLLAVDTTRPATQNWILILLNVHFMSLALYISFHKITPPEN